MTSTVSLASLTALLALLSLQTTAAGQDREGALGAFANIASVLSGPRCANCHISGDSPLQGDDGHPHTMQVRRGIDGRGTPAMRCSNCHQEVSSRTPHAPPGAPGWRLPPMATRWHGRDSGISANSIEGGVAWGLSSALLSEITFAGGRTVESNWHDYEVLRMPAMPRVEVHFVDSGARPLGGIGEAGPVTVVPALTNAIFRATGKRYRSLPLSRHGIRIAEG